MKDMNTIKFEGKSLKEIVSDLDKWFDDHPDGDYQVVYTHEDRELMIGYDFFTVNEYGLVSNTEQDKKQYYLEVWTKGDEVEEDENGEEHEVGEIDVPVETYWLEEGCPEEHLAMLEDAIKVTQGKTRRI